MADNMRTCRKTACRWPAASSLSYRYDSRQVWLLDLAEQPDPSLYDLCPPHADALVVPRGWERVDQRTHAEPVAEPAGRDLAMPGREPVGAGGYGTNRYEALSADLPRLAEELAAESAAEEAGEAAEAAEAPGEADGSDGSDEARDPATGTATSRGDHAPRQMAARPSRDLAPLAADLPPPEDLADPPAEAGAGDAAVRSPSSAQEQGPDQVPGQLAIPVPDEDARVGEAVVVSIDAGRRRSMMSR